MTPERVQQWNDKAYPPVLLVSSALGLIYWAINPSWLRFAMWFAIPILVVVCSLMISVLVDMAIEDRTAKARREVMS